MLIRLIDRLMRWRDICPVCKVEPYNHHLQHEEN